MENTYKVTDCGALGKTTEKALKEALGLKVKVAAAGRTDMRKAGVCYEVKTGAGELGDIGGKLVKGSTMVIYVPVVDESRSIDEQEGFVLSRETFLRVLDECGLLREKTSTNGKRKVTIQTFWNRKKNAPHGKGYYRLLDALYDNCEATLDEWLGERA